MTRANALGPLDPIFDVETSYGAIAAGNSPGIDIPRVTINQAAGQPDPAYESPIVFDVVFSEDVTGFATGDVTLSGTAGATTGTVAGSGTTYTVSVTGMATSGTVIATIAAGVCVSVAMGVPNAASTSTDNTVTWAWDVYFFDDFARPDGSLGNGWVPVSVAPLIVAEVAAGASGGAGGTHAYQGTAGTMSAMEIEADVLTTTFSGAATRIIEIHSMSDGGFPGVAGTRYTLSVLDTGMSLIRTSGGTSTTLDSAVITNVVPYRIKLSSIDNVHKGYIDTGSGFVEMVSAVDGTLTSGFAAFTLYALSAAPAEIDNVLIRGVS